MLFFIILNIFWSFLLIMFLVTFWLFLRKCLYPLQMYNIQISKNKKSRNYRFKMVVSIANLQYWADSKSIKFYFLNIYLIIFYLLREKQDGSLKEISESIRSESAPVSFDRRFQEAWHSSFGTTVHCFLRSVFQGTTWFFEDFRDTNFFCEMW